MELTPLWSLAPVAAAILLSLALLWTQRRYQWRDPQPLPDSNPASEPEALPADQNFKTRARAFLNRYRRELTLAGVFLGVLIFALLSAPAQMTGEIPITPGLPGRPFYFVHWQRNHLVLFFHETAAASNLLTGLLAFGLALFAMVKHSPQKTRAALLWGFMALAGSAQWMVSGEIQLPLGVALYLIAGGGFLFWSLLNNQNLSADLEGPNSLSRNWEATLVVVIIALAIFGRMFALDTVPYGIEGDEAKWTAEIVWLGIRGEPDSNGLYHRDALPVSFYMQTLFHKVMGPSLFAARFEVAFFSVIATLIFYLLLRRISAMPLALLAAWLLSASVFDISASRLANVESHVKLWPLLALALLAWAFHNKHWTNYAASGIALALGILTYDTVWPLGPVMLMLVIIEEIRQKEGFTNALRNISALLAPTLLAMPFIIPYLTSRLSYYEFGNRDWGGGAMALWEHFSRVLTSWYLHGYEDFLYNRNGPLLNAFLLPWLTFGFMALIATLRRRLSLWTLVWVLLFIFPIPIAAHSPLGRAYYPALPAMYILIAAGMYVFSRESLRALGRDFQPLVTAVALTILFWLPIFNLYIYFNEVIDFGDRLMRREIAEMAGDAASEDNLIVLASVPRGNEPLNNEYQMIELFMMEHMPIEQIAASYENVALEEILPNLRAMSGRPSRSILLDTQTFNDKQKRDDLAQALQTCYPKAEWLEGEYFTRVDLSAKDLENPACISAVLTLQQDSPTLFKWNLSQGSANRVTLACEILQINREWIEAETLNPGPGWQGETAFADGWAGEGFLMDNFDSQPTLFDFDIHEDKPVYIWARYFKRVVDTSPAQITLNGLTYSFSNINGEKINQWVWERVGPFDAPVGLNTASLHRPYNDNPMSFMALFIDTLAVTTDINFVPTADHYTALPVQTYTFPNEIKKGSIILQMEPGSFRCVLQAFSNKERIVDAFGKTPVASNPIEFIVQP
jgi:hypothetical protein